MKKIIIRAKHLTQHQLSYLHDQFRKDTGLYTELVNATAFQLLAKTEGDATEKLKVAKEYLFWNGYLRPNELVEVVVE